MPIMSPAEEQATASTAVELARPDPPPLPLSKPPGLVARLFVWYQCRADSYSTPRLLTELVALSFVLKFAAMPVVIVLPETATSNSEQMLNELSPVGIAVSALVLAPLLETLLFQWFLLWLCSRFTANWTWRIVIPSVLFALLHLPAGVLTAVSVFFPGIVFTLGFAAKRRTSRWSAFWTTSTVHAIHNALAIGLTVLARS